MAEPGIGPRSLLGHLQQQQAAALPRRTKPPEKRRCGACVAKEGEKEDASGYEPAEVPQGKLSELQQLCAETAREAEQVTGLKAVRGAGRGRGRR